MKFTIRHEIKGRIRIHLCQNHMTMRQADLLAWFLSNQPMVEEAKVYERTADAVIIYKGDRNEILEGIRTFSYENKELEIISEGMAIIPTEWKTEILCYEFKGKVEDREFLVYINAENGREEDILVINNTPNGTLTM